MSDDARFFVYAVALGGTLVPLALSAWAVVWRALHLRRARDWVEIAAGRRDPSAGLTMVHGRVETSGGPAIVVETDWIETNHPEFGYCYDRGARRVEVQPFWVRPAQGEPIRVEPDQHAQLADAEVPGPELNGRRTDRVELSPDELVYVVGDLGRGPDPRRGSLREVAEGPVLRPPRGAPMLISTQPFDGEERGLAALHRKWAIAFAGFAAGIHLVALPLYVAWGRFGTAGYRGEDNWFVGSCVVAVGPMILFSLAVGYRLQAKRRRDWFPLSAPGTTTSRSR